MSVASPGTPSPFGQTALRRWPRAMQAAAGACVTTALLALGARTAHAQEQPQSTAKITPFVEETVTTDDNVFYLSNQVDPRTVINSASRGDTFFTTSAGVTADLPVSLQRFQATLTYNGYRYDRFRQLNYDGYDMRGSWLWQIGGDLSGEVGVAENYSLTPFSQTLTQTLTQSVQPNHLHLREEFAKGSWLVTPDWKLYAYADDLNQSNSDPNGQYNNVTVDSLEASLSRGAGTGNWFGLDTRYESGHYPVTQPIVTTLGTTLVDNGYSQYGFGVVVDFGAETPSHVVARADQITRHFTQLTVRNFDRATGRLEYTWSPDVKLSVGVIGERDISPYEYIHSSIVMIRGLTLRPVWHATDALDLSAGLAWLRRTYLSDPAVALGAALPRDDGVRTTSVLLAYHPVEWFTGQLSFLHEDRASNIAFGGYAVNVAWLKVRLSL